MSEQPPEKPVMSEETMHKKPRVELDATANSSSSGSDPVDVAAEAERKRRKVIIRALKQNILLMSIKRAIERSNPLNPGATIAEIKTMLSNQSESEDDTVHVGNRTVHVGNGIFLSPDQVCDLFL